MPETCGNCGAVIGKLETAHVWDDQVVCSACKRKLVDELPVPELVDVPATAPLPVIATRQATAVMPLPAPMPAVVYVERPAPPRHRGTVTIQKTGKLWKGLGLLGGLGILGGIGLCFVQPVAGIALIVLSLPVYIFARMGAWWFHG